MVSYLNKVEILKIRAAKCFALSALSLLFDVSAFCSQVRNVTIPNLLCFLSKGSPIYSFIRKILQVN